MKPTKSQEPFWIKIDDNHWVMGNGAWRVRLYDDDPIMYYFESASGSFNLDEKESKPVLAKLGLKP